MQYHSVNNSSIYVFDDFITQDQYDQMLEVYNQATIKPTNGIYDNRESVDIAKEKTHAVNLIMANQLVFLLKFYKEKFNKRFYYLEKNIPLGFSMTSEKKPDGLPIHYDIMMINTYISKRLFGVVLYLSDDFKDGEIVFPFQSFIHKPKKGTLLTFPSHLGYPHFVRSHIGKDRIILQGYITYGI